MHRAQALCRYLSASLLAVFVILNGGLADALSLYVRSDLVNVRSGPSLSASVLTKVKYRQAVSHLGASGNFFRIKTPGGTVGYIYAPLLSTIPPPAPPQNSRPVVPKGYTVWLNTDSGVYHNDTCRFYGNTKYGAFVNVLDTLGRPCKLCGG